ncbi:hypothetical protein [Pseudonocardia acaciae]|uniref:hypothetical protein n=1 Tax=Pseudonocardia acaciae TaxID=551276 RepID=UPI00048D72A3|nr:hypothetical protein [Pseudonocardia acaciae]
MIDTKMASSLKPILRTLIDKIPGVNRAIVHTKKGFPIVTLPSCSFFRTSLTTFTVPELLRTADEFNQTMKIRGFTCTVIQLRGRTLLAIPVSDELILTLDVQTNVRLRQVASHLAGYVGHISQVAASR